MLNAVTSELPDNPHHPHIRGILEQERLSQILEGLGVSVHKLDDLTGGLSETIARRPENRTLVGAGPWSKASGSRTSTAAGAGALTCQCRARTYAAIRAGRKAVSKCDHKCHMVGLNPWIEYCPICGCLNPDYDDTVQPQTIEELFGRFNDREQVKGEREAGEKR